LKKYAVEIKDDDFKIANAFKAAHKKKKLSYVDCLGYVMAQARNIKVLTGDKQFKDLPGVEFMK